MDPGVHLAGLVAGGFAPLQAGAFSPLQAGLPDFVPDLIGLAGTLVLALILLAMGGFVYQHLTGGVEWPEERADDEGVTRSEDDDEEWKYY